MKLGQLMNLISETLDQIFMATDLKALVPGASKQLYWFSKGGLSKVFKLPASEFLRIVACALSVWFKNLMQSQY